MEYFCVPGIFHRVEKRSCHGNTSLLCAWKFKQFIAVWINESDPEMEYFNFMRAWIFSSRRKAILPWKYVTVVCLKHLIAVWLNESDPEVEYLCAPETIHAWKAILPWKYVTVVCLKQFIIKFVTQWKRSWNGIFMRAWNFSSCRKAILRQCRGNTSLLCAWFPVKQLNLPLNESDPEMEYLCAPGIFHRAEKRFCHGNTT